MADVYTDVCHAMRRWKTAIKTLVSGFSLPVASFSYPAKKKSLILRLLKILPKKSGYATSPEEVNKSLRLILTESALLIIFKVYF